MDDNNDGEKEDNEEEDDDLEQYANSDNPFILAWISGIRNEMYHERNDEYTTHNVIIITENTWQKEKIPTEEMARDSFNEFCRLNPKFIKYHKFSKAQQLKYYWEFMYAMFIRVHRNATPKYITWHVDQLSGDLKEEDPKRKDVPNNWRDNLG